ncbi:MAG: hypothetical protein GY857_14495 [Desulfobacula sp.]|nr:hypothetical protein [Desulfobacula sp.]
MSDVPVELHDNGGRRFAIDRRQMTYDVYIPERRFGKDRRKGSDRRETGFQARKDAKERRGGLLAK